MEVFDLVKMQHIKELLAKGAREDKRGTFDFRNIVIKTDVISHAEGSAQVDLGATKVLVGVKVQLDEPMPDTPDQGNLIVGAELLPLAHAEFEPGPPSPESIELARVVDRGIRAAECIDLESLKIEDGKVWSVFIDIYVLNYDGNLFDATTIAAMAALTTAKMPKYAEGNADYKERTEPLKIKNTVVSTTFGKIGETFILDPNIHEENAASTRLTITTDGKVLRAMQKGLGGSFTKAELERLVDVSLEKYNVIKAKIDELK
ncbi:MAG: exosome complex protein Rrp42 [Candidatus Marsarchaeota archaeon]|nr:exosome complex protein Rrp42 [Candidatus Marsarchaeota archaeon]